MSSFDVIVIGSGPAGCSAAATCAQAGLNVAIFTEVTEELNKIEDPSSEPLESIHPGVSSLLDRIGAAGAELSASIAHYTGIYSGTSYSALGKDENGVWEGMHINRRIFNSQLLHHILKTGVTVFNNEKVEDFILENNIVIGIKTKSAKWYAKYIIDASGKKAIAGKKLNFKRQFFSPPLICWTGVSGYIETYPFDQNAAHFIPNRNGWTWLAPQPPNLCVWTRLSLKGEKSLLPPEELKAYTTIGKISFANMRWRMFRPLCSEGILLCGDAAGILDPAAGQGIFNALLSGITAANAIVACFRKPDFASFHLAYYDDWFVRQFEEKVGRLKQYYHDHHIDILD